SLSITSSPLVRVIAWTVGAKTMVSPLWAAASRSRNVPAPWSRVLCTVRVLGTVRSSRTSSAGTNDRGGRSGRRGGRRRQLWPGRGRGDTDRGHWHIDVNIARSSQGGLVCATGSGQRPGRADQAPSPGQAGEELAGRQDLTGDAALFALPRIFQW